MSKKNKIVIPEILFGFYIGSLGFKVYSQQPVSIIFYIGFLIVIFLVLSTRHKI